MPREDAQCARTVSCRHLSIARRPEPRSDRAFCYTTRRWLPTDRRAHSSSRWSASAGRTRRPASTSTRSPTQQKAAIAEARQVYEARVAEREILHQAALRKATTYEEVERLNEEFRRDKDRLATDRDRKTAEARRAAPADPSRSEASLSRPPNSPARFVMRSGDRRVTRWGRGWSGVPFASQRRLSGHRCNGSG